MAAATATTTSPAHAHTQPQSQPAGLARWTPSLPTNIMSLLNPFANADATNDSRPDSSERDQSHNVAQANDKSHAQNQLTLKRPILSTVQFDDMSSSNPPSPSRSSGSVMFAEPDSRSNSDDGSREGSIDGLKRLKKSSRAKTRFSICHPPPESKVKQRLHRRPRALLQLHKLSTTRRPLPALEVIPSANFSIRLTRAITKVFQSKHGFCPNDLVVMKAEKYSTEEADEDQEARDVIGLICKGRKEDEKSAGGRMLIHMASGRQWEAYSTSTGGYECSTMDEHGLSTTVRWVPKKNKDGSKWTSKDGSRRFNFSTISPTSRRHPVIATLSKTGLDINDTYKIPDPAGVTPLSTPKATSTILEDAMEDEGNGKDQVETDDALREIITITSIWVTFKEGWSPSFKYDEKSKDDAGPASPGKSIAGSVATPPGSPAILPMEKRNSIRSIGSGIIRRTSLLNKSNRNSSTSVADAESDSQPPSRSASVNMGRTGRARADSSSTVLVHRAASNRRKYNHGASFRPDLNISDDLHETSREDLARDYSSSTSEVKKQSAKSSPLANGSTSRAPKRSGIAANPPQTDGDDDTDVGGNKTPSRPPPRDRSLTPDQKPGHRESTTTDASSVANKRSSTTHPMPRRRVKRQNRGWRRFLCGSSSID